MSNWDPVYFLTAGRVVTGVSLRYEGLEWVVGMKQPTSDGGRLRRRGYLGRVRIWVFEIILFLTVPVSGPSFFLVSSGLKGRIRCDY